MTNNRANKTSFKKGDKRRATGVSGRRAGVPNRLNAQCKEMIATCFENIGGQEGLDAWAKKHRTEFYSRIWIRLLGVEVPIKDDHKNVVYETFEQVNQRLGEKGLTLDILRKLCEYEERRPKLIGHVQID
jgi:hypothetical protein